MAKNTPTKRASKQVTMGIDHSATDQTTPYILTIILHKKEMNTQTIIEDITSKDIHKIRTSSCEIIYCGQDEEKIKPLIPFIELIRRETSGLDLGGAFAPNKRFPDYAIKTLEFHRDSKGCSCQLYLGEYEGFDPKRELKNGNIIITSELKGDWAYDYVVKCQKCGTSYEVMEREGHYTWWKWIKRA